MMKQRSVLRVRKPRSAWFMFGILLSTLLFMLLQGGKLSGIIFIFTCVLGIYLVLGRWSGIRKAEGTRTMLNAYGGNKLHAGDSLKLKVIFYVPGFWPLPYVRIKERLTRRSGETIISEGMIIPDWARRGELHYQTPPLRRGTYRFERTELVVTDIFGLTEHRGELELPQFLTVMPATVDLRHALQFRQLLKGMQHHTQSNQANRETTQINGVREYIYGDKLSRIHWNATARTGIWKSKEFEREALPRTIVVLDRNRRAYSTVHQFELAVSVAASLLRYGVGQRLPVGLLSVGASSMLFHPGLNNDHYEDMLTHLVDVEPDGEHSLDYALSGYSDQFMKGNLFVIVSPSIGAEVLESIHWLKRYSMRGIFMTIKGDNSRSPAEQDEWHKHLQSIGMLGYAFKDLESLPGLLEGARMNGQ